MSAFKDQGWEQRFTKMGDEAESHFEQYAKDVLDRGYVRYGLDRPPIQMHALPKRICYTPDFLMSKCFVEVQGVGRDQRIKLKFDKWNSLRWWNDFKRSDFDGVKFYVWDSHRKRETMFPLECFDALLSEGKGELGVFAEGKPYMQWVADDVFEVAA